MIVSASRRTDIPAYYADWFFRRLEERYVLVRNPMNPRCVSRVDLSPDAVDGIVFWTKDPSPMLCRLDALKDYAYYFQFTLTAYDTDIEAKLPAKAALVDEFKELADSVGPQRVIWRYDPILLNSRYTEAYHLRHFEWMARRLAGYTDKCITSFIDFYPKIAAAVKTLGISPIPDEQKFRMVKNLSEAAYAYGLVVETCAEAIDLSSLGIGHARCIDAQRLSRIAGRSVSARKDCNQRPACGCAASVDIGAYNTCPHGCRYCYANHSAAAVAKIRTGYDADAPLLCSRLGEGDTVYERPAKSR